MEKLLPLFQGPFALLIFLLVVIFAGLRGLWVWGWLYREAIRDRNYWRERAKDALGLAEATMAKPGRRPRPNQGGA